MRIAYLVEVEQVEVRAALSEALRSNRRENSASAPIEPYRKWIFIGPKFTCHYVRHDSPQGLLGFFAIYRKISKNGEV
jgi:hypothetical protein